MQVNTIQINSKAVVVAKKQRPYSNSFVVLSQHGLNVQVQCTEGSREAGRVYNCTYTEAGRLVECYTVN
jgi:hypothetical protein